MDELWNWESARSARGQGIRSTGPIRCTCLIRRTANSAADVVRYLLNAMLLSLQFAVRNDQSVRSVDGQQRPRNQTFENAFSNQYPCRLQQQKKLAEKYTVGIVQQISAISISMTDICLHFLKTCSDMHIFWQPFSRNARWCKYRVLTKYKK